MKKEKNILKIWAILTILLLILSTGINCNKKNTAIEKDVIVDISHVTTTETPATGNEDISQKNDIKKNKLMYEITENDEFFYREQLKRLRDSNIDESVKGFEDAYSSATFEKTQKIDILIKNKYIVKGSIVLDFGCGNGRYTFKLSETVGPNGRVYAVDQNINALVSILCLAQSAKQNTDNIIVKINDNYDSAVADEVIDLIFICDVHIFHYDSSSRINSVGNNFTYGSKEEQNRLYTQIDKEWGTLIDSLYKSTKKDGYLVLTEYMRCSGSKLRMSEESLIRLFEKHKFKFHKNFTSSFREEPIHYLVFKK